MYHLGASIKDLGKKCFAINKIEDTEIIEKIINVSNGLSVDLKKKIVHIKKKKQKDKTGKK
jgi:hypothetical protein